MPKKKTNKKVGGHPRVKIDWKIVDRLLEADCEGTEIAAYLGISPDSLYRRCQLEKKMGFALYLQEKKAKGNMLLKTTQFESAVKDKNIAMQIWLGKQRLDQRDKKDIKGDGSISIKVVFE